MYLFVWDSVLWGWSAGCVVVLASSLQEALMHIEAEDERAFHDCRHAKPLVIDPATRKSPYVHIQYGGD